MIKKILTGLALIVGFSTPAVAVDALEVHGLNVQGDLVYLFSEGEFAVGVGTNLATFYEIVELRGVFVQPVESRTSSKAGVGLGVNIVGVISKVGGIWLIDTINPSIGITALTNINGSAHIEPAAYLSAINIQF